MIFVWLTIFWDIWMWCDLTKAFLDWRWAVAALLSLTPLLLPPLALPLLSLFLLPLLLNSYQEAFFSISPILHYPISRAVEIYRPNWEIRHLWDSLRWIHRNPCSMSKFLMMSWFRSWFLMLSSGLPFTDSSSVTKLIRSVKLLSFCCSNQTKGVWSCFPIKLIICMSRV